MKLNKDTLASSFTPVPHGFEKAMDRAFLEIRHPAKSGTSKRHAHRLSFAATLLITLLIASIGVAAILLGGVLNFSDDYVTNHESAVEPEAKGLVQTDVAHFDFGHVTMDIVEAVYDGQELRIVYALNDPGVQAAYPDNPWQTLEEMTGLQTDGIRESIDGLAIDGQSLSWENERLSGTDTAGRVLFYKRTTLRAWGVTPPAGDFTVRLPLLEGVPLEEQPSFVMDGSLAAKFTKAGTAEPFRKDGLTVDLVNAAFTPLRATLELRITLEDAADGDATFLTAADWLAGDNLYLPDGMALSGYLAGYDPENPVLDVVILFDAPAEGWPDTVMLQANNEDQMEVHIQ